MAQTKNTKTTLFSRSSKSNNKSKSSIKKTSSFRWLTGRKLQSLVLLLAITGIGAYFVFASQASPSNCQNDGSIPICDVDQVLLSNSSRSDTVLSTDSEAKTYADKKQGTYYGAAFRAPTKQAISTSESTSILKKAVPIYRVYNESATYHDWVTDYQKKNKEAKYKIVVQGKGPAFYAWREPLAGTVPVYRITRAGKFTQAMFSTDKAYVDKLLASGKNNDEGWKKDQFGPFIAFYAYPPSYAVPGKPNPYDCTKKENFVSERCIEAQKGLDGLIKSGAVPSTNACPKDLKTYLHTAFPSQFDQKCQDFWNTYMQDCSIKENFLSDRCNASRAEVEKGIKAAKEAEERRAREAQNGSANGGVNAPPRVGDPGNPNPIVTITPVPPAPPAKVEPCPGSTPGDSRPAGEHLKYYVSRVNAGARFNDWCNEKWQTYAKQINDWVAAQAAAKAQKELEQYFRYVQEVTALCNSYNKVYDHSANSCKALPNEARYKYTCILSGEEWRLKPGGKHEWRPTTLYPPVYALNDGLANELCIQWRTYTNVQDNFQKFRVAGVSKI